ncbi:ribonuclease HII [Texcoconibacillus texcoconensis]|uniref:Ribonuclease HII n=1 Tax=Texcoconibacillus texcoconensis TaxID=1095777 RepID=A0A840QL60_9BACI|nr:ribonuclease HII [Texcoconibacillus texcoconensis]MBB5172096.1 ribonuclease HII [Texcoconibacillus texcoconensis]
MKKETISEIEAQLHEIEDENDPRIITWTEDSRKGVQSLLKRWKKRQDKKRHQEEKHIEMLMYEQRLRKEGYHYIAGIDEVGRGPLAGPVVSCAVILPENANLLGLTDSKQLSIEERNRLYEQIYEQALAVSVSWVTAEEIDEMNIYQASKYAMEQAVASLDPKPEYLLTDAMTLSTNLPQQSLIKGDALSLSIAAASVVAKVERDQYMSELASIYPAYGFERHMGYPTEMHVNALKTYGVIKEHRRSFAPVKDIVSQ